MSYDPVSPAAVSSRKVARNYTNGSGSTLPQGTPIGTLSNGLVNIIDVSNKASVDGFVGFYNQDTPSAASGQVIDSGLLENLTTSFVIGSPVYISKTGTLTNIVPVAGSNGFISGDFVVFLGVIVMNEFDNTKKDLKIMLAKPGRL
jgi:hypothetical protein